MTPARRRRGSAFWHLLATITVAVALCSCGVPGGGPVREVDAEEVPYGLLAPATPSAPPASEGGLERGTPAVFWTTGEKLVPEAVGESCTAETLAQRLLELLSAGPTEEARAGGRGSAIPGGADLELLGIDDGTAEVGIDLKVPITPDQLPVAVAQVVLTLTTAPSVSSVVLVSEGEQLQVPLPDGALTGRRVTASDYAELLPPRAQEPRAAGCRPSRT